MLKPIFDEDVDFFSKKIILCAKGGDFQNACFKLFCDLYILCNGDFRKGPSLEN